MGVSVRWNVCTNILISNTHDTYGTTTYCTLLCSSSTAASTALQYNIMYFLNCVLHGFMDQWICNISILQLPVPVARCVCSKCATMVAKHIHVCDDLYLKIVS